MLIWIAALHCEAKPVIDHYRLQKAPGRQPFDFYRRDDMTCVISGSGKLASASACAWIAARLERYPVLAWLNIGTAGAAVHDLGKAFLVDKIVDDDSGQCYYPAPLGSRTCDGATCRTLAGPGYDYREDCLFDMEASGFMQAALYFSSSELVQSIKVVSDNRRENFASDRQAVSDLIHANLEAVVEQAAIQLTAAQQLAALHAPAESWQQLLSLAHFSETQRNRLRVLWHYLHNRDHDSAELLRSLKAQDSAAAIVQVLERITRHDGDGL